MDKQTKVYLRWTTLTILALTTILTLLGFFIAVIIPDGWAAWRVAGLIAVISLASGAASTTIGLVKKEQYD